MTRGKIGVFDEPLEVSVCDQEVILLGPDGISGSFTPYAALESAKRLLRAASEVGVDPQRLVRPEAAPEPDDAP